MATPSVHPARVTTSFSLHRSSPAATLALLIALPLLLCALAGCGRQPTNEHVILITMDTTRADRLGCYGYELASTPALDSLSTASTLFAKAQVSDPNTLPSHLTMLTGHSPLGHGVRYNGWEWKVPGVPSLAELLAEAGYTTAAFISAAPLKREFGTAVGFQVFDDELGARAERPDRETADRVVEYLDSRPEGPLFLWVHFFDPHDLYEPPEPFASATKGTPYDAEISSMDHAIGRVLEALERHGYADNAHILAVADHGEGLDDREGYSCHGLLLYEEAVRAPFLWHTPGQTTARVDSSLVGCVDIFPTMLDVLGLEKGPEVEGISLRAALAGGSPPERDGVYTETIATYLLHQWSPLYGWRTDHHKYIAASVPELYDLRHDPKEKNNIADEHPDLVAQLHADLAAYVDRWSAEPTAQIGEVDAQQRELLESLGYIQASGGRKPHAPRSFPSLDDLDGLASPRTHVAMESVFVNVFQYQRRRLWQAMLDECEVIRTRLPESPALPFALAEAHGGLGHAEESLQWIERHLELRPGDSRAHRMRGTALLELGRFEEASKELDRVSPLEVDAKLHQSRLKVAAMLGDHEDIERAFRALEGEIFPTMLDSWKQAIGLLDSLGTATPAPGRDGLHLQVASLIALDIPSQATVLTDAAAGQAPDSLIARLRGDIAYHRGEWESARSSYLKAQALGASGLESRLAEVERRISRRRTRNLPPNARS